MSYRIGYSLLGDELPTPTPTNTPTITNTPTVTNTPSPTPTGTPPVITETPTPTEPGPPGFVIYLPVIIRSPPTVGLSKFACHFARSSTVVNRLVAPAVSKFVTLSRNVPRSGA